MSASGGMMQIGPFCIDGAVVELDLYSNNLVGTIPVELALLSTSVGKFVLLLMLMLFPFPSFLNTAWLNDCAFPFDR